jgi:thiol-disulfide isomerase/thioredoxin
VVLILIGAAGCVDNGTRPKEPPSLSLGVDLAGHELTTGQFRGNALLVDFWTTWAVPCRRQLSVLDTLRSQYGERLQIVAVACQERPDTVAQFLSTHPHDFRFTLDPDGTVMAAITSSRNYPTVILFDSRGEVRFQKVGFLAGDDGLQIAVRQLIGVP